MIIEGDNVAYELNDKLYHCAMDITMDYIGGKWKTVVLWYLKFETLRFSELKRKMPDITEKMLSIQLKALKKDGLINRNVYGDKPLSDTLLSIGMLISLVCGGSSKR